MEKNFFLTKKVLKSDFFLTLIMRYHEYMFAELLGSFQVNQSRVRIFKSDIATLQQLSHFYNHRPQIHPSRTN